MWKVLLVEDEVFVRESVREIIKWEEEGFHVIGEAGNGVEALDLIERFRPELVISDIVMPLMDGIELLKKSRELGFDCKFIMLSCLTDFEQVRKALEFGASNYILKLSMSVQSLKDTLKKLSHELERQRSHATIEINKFYQHVWNQIVNHSLSFERIENALYAFSEYKLVMFSVLHGKNEFILEEFYQLELIEPNQQAEIHLFTNMGQTTVFYWVKDIIHFQLKLNGDSPYSVKYSSIIQPNELMETWYQLIHELNECWHSGIKGFFPLKGSIYQKLEHYFPWERERELLHYFDKGDYESSMQILKSIWNDMNSLMLPIHAVKETAIRIDHMWSRISNSKAIDPRVVEKTTSHHQLLEVMFERLRTQLNFRGKEPLEITDHTEINKVITYIKENYAENITVKFLAHYISMDENYLSGLFKKKTGITLIQYIHRIRVAHAKRYLEKTNLSISDICTRIGFINDNYFIKVFKRFTNQTPGEYRNNVISRKTV